MTFFNLLVKRKAQILNLRFGVRTDKNKIKTLKSQVNFEISCEKINKWSEKYKIKTYNKFIYGKHAILFLYTQMLILMDSKINNKLGRNFAYHYDYLW